MRKIIKAYVAAVALTYTLKTINGNRITDIVYDLIGNYSFLIVILFVVFVQLFSIAEQNKHEENRFIGLSLFLSTCLLVGKSFAETNSFSLCFGSVPTVIMFTICMLGYTCIFSELIPFFISGYERLLVASWKFSISYKKALFIIFLFWLPAIVLSYPGNVCYDVLGEIGMALGESPITAHHPLLHILLIGLFVKIGELIGNIAVGLFIYILVQALMLATALAGTIFWLKKERACSNAMMLVILGIYCISPMYSNMASTAIKDVPFIASVIWYVILLAELAFHRERIKETKFVVTLVAFSVLICLLRNNGIYMIILSGVIISANWWKESDRINRIRLLLSLVVLPVVFSKLVDGGLKMATNAEDGSIIEACSVPFQQSARYLQLYKDELSDEEIVVYNNTFVDYREVAAAYNPNLADPVKTYAYYGKEKGTLVLTSYFKIWFKDFFKHPLVYFEAFIAHVYGWFDPALENAPRYEVEESIFGKGLSFSQKVILFYYRFAEKITPLNILQNVGIYTWLLFILLKILRNNKKIYCLTAPLVTSLLICMASPCFYGHPRYAFPYMFTLPFYYGFAYKKD